MGAGRARTGDAAGLVALAVTERGSVAEHGTRPQSRCGPAAGWCRSSTRPPPAIAATVAVVPAAVSQRCLIRRPDAPRGSPSGGLEPLTMAAQPDDLLP